MILFIKKKEEEARKNTDINRNIDEEMKSQFEEEKKSNEYSNSDEMVQKNPEQGKKEDVQDKKSHKTTKDLPEVVDIWKKKVKKKDLKKILEANPLMKSFIKKLYHEIYQTNNQCIGSENFPETKKHDYSLFLNRTRTKTFNRDFKYRVQDAINRIIVGNERCCASTFYQGRYYVAANLDEYQKQNLYVRFTLKLTHKILNTSYEIHPELHISVKEGENCKELIIKGKAVLCEVIANRKVLVVDNEIQTFSLQSLQDIINDFQDNESISRLCSESFPIQLFRWYEKQLNGYEDCVEIGTFISNSLRTRYEQLINYITGIRNLNTLLEVFMWNESTEIKEEDISKAASKIADSVCELLFHSIFWKASSWCSIKNIKAFGRNLESQESSSFFQEFKKFFDKFYRSWKDLKSQKKGTNFVQSNYEEWMQDCLQKVKSEELIIPESFVKKYQTKENNGSERFLFYCTRYLIDIEELERYIIRDDQIGGSLAKWIVSSHMNKDFNGLQFVESSDKELHAEMKLFVKFLTSGDLQKLEYISTSLLCCPHCYFTLKRFKFAESIKADHSSKSYKVDSSLEQLFTAFGIKSLLDNEKIVEAFLGEQSELTNDRKGEGTSQSSRVNGYHGQVSTSWRIPSIIRNNEDNLRTFIGESLYEEYKTVRTEKIEGPYNFKAANQGEFALEMIENIGRYSTDELMELIEEKRLENDDRVLPDIPSADIEENFKNPHQTYNCNVQ